MQISRTLAKAGLGVLVIGLTACGAPAAESAAPSTDVPRMVAGSAVKFYDTAADVAADSSAQVLGEVTSSSVVSIQDLRFTKYVFAVKKALSGTVPDVIDVYQVGEPGWQFEDDLQAPGYLAAGHTFVLFIHATDLPAGTIGSDGYYITGPSAWANDDAPQSAGMPAATAQFKLWQLPEAAKKPRSDHLPAGFRFGDITSILLPAALGHRQK
jgi:hypothetical protein